MKYFNALLIIGFLGLGIAAETMATRPSSETCDMKSCPKEMCGSARANCDMPCCQK
jgi:hypothetical protein